MISTSWRITISGTSDKDSLGPEVASQLETLVGKISQMGHKIESASLNSRSQRIIVKDVEDDEDVDGCEEKSKYE
jgi:hypothetical protein